MKTKGLIIRIKYLFLVLLFIGSNKLIANDYEKLQNPNLDNEIIVESDKQSTDFSYSIFYAEGNVLVTNYKKEFVAKSQKAIFYKLEGKIKLMGNVEVSTNDFNKIKAAQVIYYVNENKFEAISDSKQRVSSSIMLNN